MPHNNSTQTDRLLERVCEGDTRAIGTLLAAHRQYLRRIIELRLDDELKSRIDPSDVVQETQAVAAARMMDFAQSGLVPFRIWLRQNAIEQIIDLRRHHIKRQKRSVRREVPLSNASRILAKQLISGPSGRMRQAEQRAVVQEAISKLNEMDREVLLLRNVEELSNDEIAHLLKIDKSAASKRYGRALIRLREQLVALGAMDGD